MDYKARNHKTLRGKHRKNSLSYKSQQGPLGPTFQSNGRENKTKWDLLKRSCIIDLMMICQEQHLLQVIVDYWSMKDGQMSGTDCVNGWGSWVELSGMV